MNTLIKYQSYNSGRPKTVRSSHPKPLIVALFLVGIIGIFSVATGHASSQTTEMKSGIAGYCMDDRSGGLKVGNPVYSWPCNGTEAQDWKIVGNTIRHSSDNCLDVFGNSSGSGSRVVLNPCSSSASQNWIAAVNGYENTNSGLCLATPTNQTKAQLVISSCGDLSQHKETWSLVESNGNNQSSGASTACKGSEGQRVACYAAQEWTNWQSGPLSHNQLLNNYTDGNGQEEWCADFVSYVYKEAGFPFSQGERDGWDEYLAPNIQNMGFTIHDAGHYTPRAGDVAYFDYNGGHVEIVVVGGSKPIYIYGDSAKIDPASGNGDMAENTITSDNSGQVMYYLSPN